METSFRLSEEHSCWVRRAIPTFRINIVHIMSRLIKGWITSNWRPTLARYKLFGASHAYLKLQSRLKVNTVTFGLLEWISVKTDTGWFLTTDRPQISSHKYYSEANWGWPSHKNSTNLFLLSTTESIMCHRYWRSQLLPICFVISQCF